MQNIKSDLVSFKNTNAVDQLTSANSRVENFYLNLPRVYDVKDNDDTIRAYNANNKFIDEYGKVISNINSTKKDFLKSITDLKEQLNIIQSASMDYNEKVERQTERIDTAINAFQGQFSEGEDRRRKEFETLKSDLNNQQAKIIEKNASEAATSIAILKDSLNTQQDKLKNVIETKLNLFAEKIDVMKKSIDHDSNEIIKDLQSQAKKAREIVNIIADHGITGNYKKIANEEKRLADNFRNTAIFFMVIAAGVVAWFVYGIDANGFSWQIALFRLFIAIILLVPAGYSAQQSSMHRKNEIYNRKMELELTSIGPYLELLPKEKQDAIKEKFTEKFFGQEVKADSEDKAVKASSIFKLLEKTIDKLIR